MCFVLDINSFHSFFNENSSDHQEYIPIVNWLYDPQKKTCLVYGGRTYKEELNKIPKYFTYLAELERKRKLAIIKDDIVDTEEVRVKSIENDRDFDDAHIVALFCASGCRIFVTHDRRSDRFIKMQHLYTGGQRRPKIYKTRNHFGLLCRENLVSIRNAL